MNPEFDSEWIWFRDFQEWQDITAITYHYHQRDWWMDLKDFDRQLWVSIPLAMYQYLAAMDGERCYSMSWQTLLLLFDVFINLLCISTTNLQAVVDTCLWSTLIQLFWWSPMDIFNGGQLKTGLTVTWPIKTGGRCSTHVFGLLLRCYPSNAAFLRDAMPNIYYWPPTPLILRDLGCS